MKFVISFLFFLTTQVALANLIVIKTDGDIEEALLLKDAFKSAYQIPDEWFLITDKEDARSGKIIDVFLNKKGEPIEFSKNDKQIIALKILKKKDF